MRHPRLAAVPVALLLAAAVTGCSSDQTPSASQGTSAASPAQSTSAAPKPGDEVDKEAFFTTTQKAMYAAKTYTMTMHMATGGEKVTMTGKGDVSDRHRPKADMSLAAPGGSQMHMIMDGEAVFMKLPAVAKTNKYVKMPIQALSQAGGQDLGKLMNPAENLRLTQQAVQKVVYQGPQQQDGQNLEHYAITLDPQKLQQGLSTGAPSATASAPSSLPYDVWLDSDHRIRKMTMNVQGTSMTMTVDKYGQPVSIAAPPQASVTEMPGISGQSPAPSPTTQR